MFYICIILNEIDINTFSNYGKEIIEFYFKLLIHFIYLKLLFIILYIYTFSSINCYCIIVKIINFILFDNLKNIQKTRIIKDFVKIIAENFSRIILVKL